MSMIPVFDAVQKAKGHLLGLYADDPPKQLALEEVEQATLNGREAWAVTLGFHRQKSVTPLPGRSSLVGVGLLGDSSAQVENRVYKTVYIDGESGDFIKMDIRQVS